MRELFLMPFIIELFGDKALIDRGKKDIHWTIRGMLMLGFASEYFFMGSFVMVTIDLAALLLMLLPYCFFDPILNKYRGKKWSHTGTKIWDRVLSKVKPHWVLVGRFIFFFAILFLSIKIIQS